MEYTIVTIDFLKRKGFEIEDSWRKSINGEKVILHYGKIKPILNENEIVDIYNFDSEVLNLILNSSEWVNENIINNG